ncbi:MAG TPA: hypothetical protein PLV68_08290, partial [Ilumatobacteraceae bacterium]|nr:hypothetical protein [Ilumatobacteraceae bacterium]
MPKYRRLFAALALTVVTLHGSGALAQAATDPTLPAGETAEDAAKAIIAARKRANEAADAWVQAHSRLDGLRDEKASIERDIADLQR